MFNQIQLSSVTKILIFCLCISLRSSSFASALTTVSSLSIDDYLEYNKDQSNRETFMSDLVSFLRENNCSIDFLSHNYFMRDASLASLTCQKQLIDELVARVNKPKKKNLLNFFFKQKTELDEIKEFMLQQYKKSIKLQKAAASNSPATAAPFTFKLSENATAEDFDQFLNHRPQAQPQLNLNSFKQSLDFFTEKNFTDYLTCLSELVEAKSKNIKKHFNPYLIRQLELTDELLLLDHIYRISELSVLQEQEDLSQSAECGIKKEVFGPASDL